MKKVYSIILSSYTILMSSLMNLNGGTLDATNSNLIVNSSNIIFPQNSDISSNKFTITNSSISVKNLNTTLGLNNSWTGTNTFTKDVSFNNTKTQISSTGVIGLSGGIINISGGIVNIAGPTTIGGAWATSLAGDTTITSNNIYLNNIPLTSDLSCITYNPATKRIGYTSLPNNLSLNNQWTGTNTFTNDVSLNSNVYAGALASTPSDTNCVSFNPSTKKLGYTAIPALLPSNNTWTGTNTFNNNVSFNNTTTQINSTSVVGLSGGIVNISGGTVNIAGVTTHSQNTYVLGGVGIGKNSVSSGYALDVSGSAIINNGSVGIGTIAPASKMHIHDSSNPKIFLGNGTNRSFFSLFGGNTDIGCDVGSTPIRFMPDSTEKMRITAAGKVGIGTTTPNAPLQFSNEGENRKIVLYDVENDNLRYYGFGINSSALRYSVDTSSSSHVFYAGGVNTEYELMRIKGNGTVGIGITNPVCELDVSGSLNVRGSSNANVFKTLSGSFTNDATFKTIFTLPPFSAYLLTMISGVGDGNYGMFSIIIDDTDKTFTNINSNNIILQFSGNSIQAKTFNGNSYNMTWTALRTL